LDGETLLIALDDAGVEVSAGSACAAGSLEPSHVLLAMGLPEAAARASLRFSVAPDTTEAEVREAAGRVEEVVGRLRGDAERLEHPAERLADIGLLERAVGRGRRLGAHAAVAVDVHPIGPSVVHVGDRRPPEDDLDPTEPTT
jgi:hypothetical protein